MTSRGIAPVPSQRSAAPRSCRAVVGEGARERGRGARERDVGGGQGGRRLVAQGAGVGARRPGGRDRRHQDDEEGSHRWEANQAGRVGQSHHRLARAKWTASTRSSKAEASAGTSRRSPSCCMSGQLAPLGGCERPRAARRHGGDGRRPGRRRTAPCVSRVMPCSSSPRAPARSTSRPSFDPRPTPPATRAGRHPALPAASVLASTGQPVRSGPRRELRVASRVAIVEFLGLYSRNSTLEVPATPKHFDRAPAASPACRRMTLICGRDRSRRRSLPPPRRRRARRRPLLPGRALRPRRLRRGPPARARCSSTSTSNSPPHLDPRVGGRHPLPDAGGVRARYGAARNRRRRHRHRLRRRRRRDGRPARLDAARHRPPGRAARRRHPGLRRPARDRHAAASAGAVHRARRGRPSGSPRSTTPPTPAERRDRRPPARALPRRPRHARPALRPYPRRAQPPVPREPRPDGRFLPVEELRAKLGEAGITGNEPVVSYCGSGVTACHNLLAIEHAGLGAGRLFPGSWSQWSRDPDRPIGDEPSAALFRSRKPRSNDTLSASASRRSALADEFDQRADRVGQRALGVRRGHAVDRDAIERLVRGA